MSSPDTYSTLKARFNKLPPELRLMIIEALVTWPGTVSHQKYYTIRQMLLIRHIGKRRFPLTGSLITKYFYERNHILIESTRPSKEERHATYGASRVRFPPPKINTFVRNLEVHIWNNPYPLDQLWDFFRLLASGTIGFDKLKGLTISTTVRPGRPRYDPRVCHDVHDHQPLTVAELDIFVQEIRRRRGLKFRTKKLMFRTNGHTCGDECTRPFNNDQCRANSWLASVFGVQGEVQGKVKKATLPTWYIDEQHPWSDPCAFSAYVEIVDNESDWPFIKRRRT